MLRRSTLIGLVAALCSVSTPARAAETPGPCDAPVTAAAALIEIMQRVEAGPATEAVAFAKACGQRFPDDEGLVLALAEAYRAAGNAPWARRTLARLTDSPTHACAARAHLAWALLVEADYRGARDALAGEGCPTTPPDAARWRLLAAFADHQGRAVPDAREHLAAAQDAPVVYPEDRALLAFLAPRLFPLRRPAAQVEGELRAGWSSNPLLGSPLDPFASGGDYQSPKLEADLWARLASPFFGPVSVFVEADLKGQQLLMRPARELSYAGGGLRPGLVLDRGDWALTLAYHADVLAVAATPAYADQGPWLYLGHRAEAALELANGLSFFAGGGRRDFRDLGRARFEADGGLTGRVHRATNDAWNLWGLTGLGSVRVRLFAGWSARGLVSVAYEAYPDSEGAAAFHAVDARTDWMARGRVEAWTPPLPWGLQAGVRYQPSRRFSNAALFDFTDHTVLAVLTWRFAAEPWQPRESAPAGHVPLRYGLDGGTEGLGERLQDLLRQDEESQRGSSCLN
jgi:hypothetical protein